MKVTAQEADRRRALARRLHSQGLTTSEIAARAGMRTASVARYLRHGAEAAALGRDAAAPLPQVPDVGPEAVASIAPLLRQGLKVVEIAKSLGYSRTTVYAVRAALGDAPRADGGDADICALHRKGLNAPAIAKRLGKPIIVVERALARGKGAEGPPKFTNYHARRTAILALADEGLDVEAIADRLGLDDEVVGEALTRKFGRPADSGEDAAAERVKRACAAHLADLVAVYGQSGVSASRGASR